MLILVLYFNLHLITNYNLYKNFKIINEVNSLIVYDDIEQLEYREDGDYIYKKVEGMIFKKKLSGESNWGFVAFINDEFRELFK